MNQGRYVLFAAVLMSAALGMVAGLSGLPSVAGAAGTSAKGGGFGSGSGGGQTKEQCPGGSTPVCVRCDGANPDGGIRCVRACVGDFTCKYFDVEGTVHRACATSIVCSS
jgi:hypothetical protein